MLFLDELEALSSRHEAKLLRVIDAGEVRPLGAAATRRVSARFLAATNQDPRRMIQMGELREDLYYRLCGFAIHLPPLRDRLEDVPLLVDHFLRPTGRVATPDGLAWLRGRDWPGNVRELENVMKGAQGLTGDGPIGVEVLRACAAGACVPEVPACRRRGGARGPSPIRCRRAFGKPSGRRS